MWLLSHVAVSTLILSGAQVAPPQTNGMDIAQQEPGLIITIDFDSLDDPSKRRLNYYASNILTNISEMSLLERAGDGAAVNRTLNQTRQLAVRMETAALDFGLTRGEMLTFFLTKLSTELRGPIPNAILSDDGQFMATSLFNPVEEDSIAQASDNGYINLLRDEGIGGVDVTN